MAGRIADLSFGNRGHVVDMEPAALITPKLVDEAVEEVLRDYDEGVKEEYMRAWAADDTSEVARLLQASIAARTTHLKAYADVARKPVVVEYVLDEEQQKGVVERYSDMEILFRPKIRHDHSLAATDRKLGDIKLHSRIPAGMRYVDFGGSILMHVQNGNTNVLVVGGQHDKKDGARSTKVRMRLNVIANDPNSSDASRMMARSVLAGEGRYYVEDSLQSFTGQFRAGVMSHVYDVPMIEIAKMMKRCGMSLFEGLLHFSSRFFLEDAGELESVGARFKIEQGEFQMGFLDSPAHWYGHSWKDFSAYGVDQALPVGDRLYSYKIHERRGDTISFRVLAVRSAISHNRAQHIARPGIPMVEVSTYEHKNLSEMQRRYLTSVKRFYPADVWERMTREAMLAASKGDLDFNSHVRTYRTIVAGHKYNGVSTVSDKIPTSEVPWLVVDSAVYGLAQVVLLRRGARAFVAEEFERRMLAGRSAVSNVARAFCAGLKAALLAPFLPIQWLVDRLVSVAESNLESLVEVSPVPRFVMIDSLSIHGGSPNKLYEAEKFPLLQHMLDNAAVDDYVKHVVAASKLEQSMEPSSAGKGEVRIDGVTVDSEASTTAVGGTAGDVCSDKPDWVPMYPEGHVIVEKYEYNSQYHTEEQRREAVYESARVSDAESAEVEAWCAAAYTKFAGGREPNAEEVRRNKEHYRDFDFWRVNEGVIGDSITGRSVDTFSASGVYCPMPIEAPGEFGRVKTNLIPVSDASYVGRGVFKSHKVIDTIYSGYVLTCTDLDIFNSRLISAGLRYAATLSFSSEMAGMVGGPGCGKTTSIVDSFERGDMVVTPLVISAKSVRKALVDKGKLTPQAAQKCVRTLDSLLCEAGRKAGTSVFRPITAYRVFVDECFNALPGRFYATLAMLKAERVMMYGDRKQIAPVIRAKLSVVYNMVSFPHVVRRFTVFRPAPQILACFNGHYGNTLRTASKAVGSAVVMQGSYPTLSKSDDVAILVMNQASKPLAAKVFPHLKDRITSTHEKQGGEADIVVLLNFEVRKIGEENPTYLYNVAEYVNVAISRTKKHFYYCCVSGHDDLVRKFVRSGASPVAIQACADLKTAGKAY